MLNNRILLLSKKHTLSLKLYDILKRDYKVELLCMEYVIKDRENLYTSAFYGVDQIIFTTEFIWELFCSIEEAIITKFFNKLFQITSKEIVKITYISQDYLFNQEYFFMSNDVNLKFSYLKNYVESTIKKLDNNCIINVPSVYGISNEKDIIYLIKAKQIDQHMLIDVDGPVLADKVALYVSQNMSKSGTIEYPVKRIKFLNWLDINFDKEYEAKSEDTIIRSHQEHCVFDLVYKREASSYYRNQCIAEKRIEIGKKLAENIPLNIRSKVDFVTPVPRTGAYYAMGLSEGLNVPYREVLIKETYSKRSFSMTSTDERKKFLWKKISPIPELIRGKKVAVVDEAIFTGTTLKVVCEMLWNCDVKEIYLCIPTPPCQYHCNYLVHPPRKMLLEYMSLKYMKEYFNVTDIFFQNEEYFAEYNKNIDCQVCLECFYGVK